MHMLASVQRISIDLRRASPRPWVCRWHRRRSNAIPSWPDEAFMSVAAESISPPARTGTVAPDWWRSPAARVSGIAALASVGIVAHLALRWASDASPAAQALPLYVVLVAGGVPLV